MQVTFPSGRSIEIDTTFRPRLYQSDGKPKPPRKKPSYIRQAWNYAAAVKRWIAGGGPRRSQDEIDRIFAICQACPYFANTKKPHCRLCGCSLGTAPDGLKNKLAMATESCPANPPKWTAEA